MNFETEKTLKSVLDFYQSSGLIPATAQSITIDCSTCFSADGNRPQLEQLLFFVLGHLLPEFVPHQISCIRLQKESNLEFMLGLRLDFTGVTMISMQEILSTLHEDSRLERMLATCHARLDLQVNQETTQKSLILEFPVSLISAEPRNAVIDFDELAKRYDGMELAITLLDGFVMNSSRHISLMRSAMEHDDWKEAHRHAHALKGGALNVCAENLARKAKIIETLIKDEHYNDVADQVDQLEQACTELELTWFKHQEELNG